MDNSQLDQLFQSIENLPPAAPKRNLYAQLIQHQQEQEISSKWTLLYAASLVGLIGLNLFFYSTYAQENKQEDAENYEYIYDL